MLAFLFWNLGGKNAPLEDKAMFARIVSALAHEHSVDILMLAENVIPPTTLLETLNPLGEINYFYTPSYAPTWVDIYFRYLPEFIKPLADIGRLSIRKVALPARAEFLLCTVHLHSQYALEPLDQTAEAIHVNETIREAEENVGHARTIVVGDFNMNPFHEGILSASAFNAVMSADIAQRGTRTHLEREHPFFYNPMWGQLGDSKSRPPGSFFYHPPGQLSIYWHMLDQVLLRPDMIAGFDSSSLRILDSSTEMKLVAKGRPCVSDHLPLFFRLNI
jgi:hypothetical protein